MKKTAFTIGFSFSLVMLLGLTLPVDHAQAEKHKGFQTQVTQRKEPFVPGRVLVKFRSDVGLDHARQVIAALGAREDGMLPRIDVFVLDLPEQADEAAFANALHHRPDVEFAELDRINRPADVTPSDPWYPNEWYLPKIAAPAAWSSTTGSQSIVIAILDTGVDSTHPDLQNQIVPGWNVYNNNSDTSDVGSHGTGVAGTVAASSNNGIGIASACWACKIMPVRVSDINGYATDSSIATGLTWAADHGARVANVSYIVSSSSTVTTGAKYFQGKGGVVTVSAGNNGSFISSSDNPYVLTVTASNPSDQLYAWSNTGNNLDLAAPGEVYTTIPGAGYTNAAGTSFSAPLVAGVAALVMSANPSLTPTQVQDVLKKSADDLGTAGWDSTFGWGRVNAARAVSLASGSQQVDVSAPAVSFLSPGNGATVSGSISVGISASDNTAVTSVAVAIDGSLVTSFVAAPYTFSWNTSAVPDGTHTLSATALDGAGNSSVNTISVTVRNTVDNTSPSISLVSPSDGAKVSGTVTVSVSASDDTRVVRVELYVDNVLQASSTSAPFDTKWNTRKTKAGAHSVQCKAYDSVGNVGRSQIYTLYK
jgi:subtilisin family serine protease